MDDACTREDLSHLDELYRERVLLHDASQPGYLAAWEELSERLLELGGLAVVPPVHIEGIEFFVARAGASFAYGGFVAGEPNACHANSAELFLSGAVAALASGFALSSDGLWRMHSWGVDSAGRAVETTVRREAYFGILFEGEAAQEFCRFLAE
jgi:hypothetical protein